GVMAPMLEQPGGFRSDLPLARREVSPGVDSLANLVDEGREIVLLPFRRKAFIVVKPKVLLTRRSLALLGLGNRGDEFRPAAALNNLLCRLAVCVQFPVPIGVFVG